MPTRRSVLTSGCVALGAAALAIVAAQATPGRTTSSSAAAFAAEGKASPAISSPFTEPQSAPGMGGHAPQVLAPAAGTSPSTPSPAAIVLPPAPIPAPAKQDALSVVVSSAPVVNHPASKAPGAPKPAAPKPAAPKQAAPASGYPQRADIANAVYSMINSERASNGLPALGRSGQLNSSAHAHNVAMANTGQFSHQVSGEASLGARISASGYHWVWAGENIAWGSYASVAFAQQLEAQMYGETPPNDGHRLNILSSSAHNVGVDVITDGTGKMWITCDFGS